MLPDTGAIVVLESAGVWAAALRRQCAERPVRVIETRSRSECLEVVDRLPCCFVVVEFNPADVDRGLKLLVSLERRFPLVPAIAVAPIRLRPYEWLVRELGAIHFVTNTRALRQAIPVVRRHLAQATTPPISLTEQILAGLPWGE